MFFALDNLTATAVRAMDKAPWELPNTFDYAELARGGKAAFSKWVMNPETKHTFFSAFEGHDPYLRVGANDNQAYKMHALVVDFDGPFGGQEEIDKVLANPPSEFLPAYISETFSGHSRAVWLFEEPVSLGADKFFASQFVRQVIGGIKASKWFAGMDPVVEKTSQYYELGKRWFAVAGAKPISANRLGLWALKAGDKVRFKIGLEGIEVALSDVKPAFDAKFPGVWPADKPFEEGQRTRRFWDPNAKNETSAILRKDGFQCFSGDKPFMPWGAPELLGAAWVGKFEEDRTGAIKARTVYEETTKSYYVRDPDEVWRNNAVAQFTRTLKKAGFNPDRLKNETISAVDSLIEDVTKENIVEGALPFVHMPKGVIDFKGKKILNTSRIQVVKPSGERGITGDWHHDGPLYFPFHYEVMGGMFERDTVVYEITRDGQLQWFLSWLNVAYTSALAESPMPGQALFIGGNEGRGKTLLVHGFLGKLMGGCEDASSWLTEGSQWTDDIAGSPILAIDDALALCSHSQKERFSTLLKKLVANRILPYNGKWKGTGSVWWSGRCIVTFNLDSISLQILPTMEVSNRSKISMLLTNAVGMAFPHRDLMTKKIAAEVSNFAQFLTKFKIPECFINKEDTRYVIKSFHHPELFDEAMKQGPSMEVLGVIELWAHSYRQANPTQQYWEGSAVHAHQVFKSVVDMASNVRGGVNGISNAFSTLSSRGYPIAKVPGERHHVQKWRIDVEAFSKHTAREMISRVEGAGTNIGAEVLLGDSAAGVMEVRMS